MEVINKYFDDSVIVFRPRVFKDKRGFFQESYTQNKFEIFGINNQFIQDNHSFSELQGTIRGLHFQTDPMAQAKLVRAITGKIWDVVVDLRAGSPTYKKWVGFELSGENFHQVIIPAGFAHGFCTLTPNCHVVYKVDQFYSPENNAGVLWSDPDLAIQWPTEDPVLSAQDKLWPKLEQAGAFF